MKKILTIGMAIVLALALGYWQGRSGSETARGSEAVGSASDMLSAGRSKDAIADNALRQQRSGGQVHTVKDGDSIQAAVAAAQPGDTIRVMPGTYKEVVYVDKDDIALVGVISGGR